MQAASSFVSSHFSFCMSLFLSLCLFSYLRQLYACFLASLTNHKMLKRHMLKIVAPLIEFCPFFCTNFLLTQYWWLGWHKNVLGLPQIFFRTDKIDYLSNLLVSKLCLWVILWLSLSYWSFTQWVSWSLPGLQRISYILLSEKCIKFKLLLLVTCVIGPGCPNLWQQAY